MTVYAICKSQLKIIPKFPLHSIRTAVKLSYKIFGESEVDPDDPPIFLFHDLLGTKKHWDSLGKTMVNMTKRSVVAVDLRNHGDSPHASSHKYEDMADDILKLFKKLSVDKASIVGHGMGGRASMCVSLIDPEKVAGLLIVDISPVSTCNHLKEFTKVLAIIKEINFKEQKKICTAKRHVKKKLKTIIQYDDTLMNNILSNIILKSNGLIGWSCNLDVLIKDFKNISSFPKMKNKKYFGPALFIGGQLSEYIPPDDLNGIREMFPRAVISYIPQTGHSLHIDDPKSFLEVAIAFLRTNE
ncbi:protein ABHD11-like [Colias croceus]|uniref:protein ABHD11-like n=1 Tax=Colias crocea TaxID=72248 RepID=UPI001E27CB11|nr:protein ABHD11-like [Colias croceus]